MARSTVDVSFEEVIDEQIGSIAKALWCLSRRKGGNDLGAIEFLATETRAGLDGVAAALNNVATAIRGKEQS
jgi:hypothetical protein